LARDAAPEGLWLRAERQTAGRGRQGRAWSSPAGNLYASTIVRLRPNDPPAATLALVAAVALEEVVRGVSPSPFRRFAPPFLSQWERERAREPKASGKGEGELTLKWPNDLLLDGAKLSGILLERTENAVVIGFGVNLAHHPTDTDRLATSLAEYDARIGPAPFLEMLAETFARWLARWRAEGIAPVRDRWIERAHPAGTALTARLPDGSSIDGLFERLDADGALVLRLASGERRVIHAGDVFLI
jgi:BirA family biotin operon repressor/biotin-[acetyl-CoA-carboxylase] ligase